MKLTTFIYFIIHLISLFLPIIHLVEISHAHTQKNHEIQTSFDNTPQTPECRESIVNNDLEKSLSFVSQNTFFIDIPKNTYIQEELWFRKNIPVLLPKGHDPPFKNTYTYLVGIIKIQIFDVI